MEYDWGMRIKTSVTLPTTLLDAIDKVDGNRSAFIERAAIAYLTNLERRHRDQLDTDIINRNSKRLNREAEDVLGYQRLP